jgi:hypothetical protein
MIHLKDELALIVIAGIVLLAVVPLTMYYLGTLGGVNFGSMSNDLVMVGVFLFLLFIAIIAVAGHMRH